MITVRRSAGIAATFALALSLSACSTSSNTATDTPTGAASAVASASASLSSNAPSSVSAASEAFCTSSAALKTELGNFKTLVQGGSVTTEALQSEKQGLAAAGDQAKTDAQALDKAVQAQVTAAQTTFQAAIDAIPDDQTGVKEVAAYVAAAGVFSKALDGIVDEVGCA